MFGFKKSWHSYKRELLKKHLSQIDKVRYQKANHSLLITAVMTGNDCLFDKILASDYFKEALYETDLKGCNALNYALFSSKDYYERMKKAGGVLSDYPSEVQEMIVSDCNYLLSHRKKISSDYYQQYLKRLKNEMDFLPKIDFETSSGETLLTVAVQHSDEEMIDYLLQKGASPLKGYVDVNSIDMNALDLAVFLKKETIIEQLKGIFPVDMQNEILSLSQKKAQRVNTDENKGNGLFSHIMALGLGGLLIIGMMHDCQPNRIQQKNKQVFPVKSYQKGGLPHMKQKNENQER